MEGRFLVRSRTIGPVRRALRRAPGNCRVLGFAGEGVVEVRHTIHAENWGRIWPQIRSRLAKAGLEVVA